MYLEQISLDFELVGLSVGIVQNDTVVYSKGFGIKEIGKDSKVNDQTTFGKLQERSPKEISKNLE